MKRRHLLRIIVVSYFLASLGGFSWFGLAYLASRPVSTGSVQGASTQPLAVSRAEASKAGTAESVRLSAYPTLSVPKRPAFNARQYLLYHAESGRVILRSDSVEPVAIASTTKLMTALLTSRLSGEEEVALVPAICAAKEGSSMNLRPEETLTVKNLLYGTLLVSGNDAACALAAHVGGKLLNLPEAPEPQKISRFVEEMNSTAAHLSLIDTEYKDPAGLNDDGRSSAFDIAKLTSVAMQVPLLSEIMRTAQYSAQDTSQHLVHELRNSNRFVTDYQYPGILAGKTGFTLAAGHCLAVAARRDGATLIAVVLNTFADTKEASAVEARKILDFGFQNIRWE
jgi:D-alanyl-D-alanine carboxypeptidase (penicillin-binding protein 5/6)